MNRKPRSWRRRLKRLWEGLVWYAGLPGHYLGQVRQFLARGWRRRFGKVWQGGLWYLGLPFFMIGRMVRRGGRFLAWWWRSRSIRLMLQGLPALVLGAAVIFLAVYVKMTPEARAVDAYLRQGGLALQEKDYETAKVCFERLAILNQDSPEYLYHLAVATALAGQHERSAALMAKLAPLDRQGYAPAHLVQARQLLAGPGVTMDMLKVAELHLVRTLQADPDNSDANAMLGQVLLVTKRPKEAEPYLLKAVSALPELRLKLAILYQTLGNQEEARRQGEQAVQVFKGQVKASVDNHQARVYLAEAHVLLKNYREAQATLEQALALFNHPLYRLKLGQVFLAWSDSLEEGDPKTQTGNKLLLLERAMHYDADNGRLALSLIALTNVKGLEGEKAQKHLDSLLAQGKSATLVHLLMGMNAWEQGKTDEARHHLETAYQLDPQASVVANNLAYALAHQKEPDLPRAFAMISALVQRFPNEPEFRDTRGQILAKMERWKEALPDLEAGLKRVSDKRNAHRALAKVYQELGNPGMAEEHKRLADAKTP